MKRKIAMVMVSVLTVFTLAACGDKASTDTNTSTSTEAPVAAEPIESVTTESVASESNTDIELSKHIAQLNDLENDPSWIYMEYVDELEKSIMEKYHLNPRSSGIELDGDTPTEVLEALLDEEELGLLCFFVDTKYYVDPDDPEFRQEILDVLVKNEELRNEHVKKRQEEIRDELERKNKEELSQ